MAEVAVYGGERKMVVVDEGTIFIEVCIVVRGIISIKHDVFII